METSPPLKNGDQQPTCKGILTAFWIGTSMRLIYFWAKGTIIAGIKQGSFYVNWVNLSKIRGVTCCPKFFTSYDSRQLESHIYFGCFCTVFILSSVKEIYFDYAMWANPPIFNNVSQCTHSQLFCCPEESIVVWIWNSSLLPVFSWPQAILFLVLSNHEVIHMSTIFADFKRSWHGFCTYPQTTHL